MALSTRPFSRSTIKSLARNYEIVDSEEVFAFLERYPELPPLLPEIRDAIRRYFGKDRVKLEVSRDPEWPEDEKVVVNIQTSLRAREALDRLHEFDREWWLDRYRGIEGPILVSIIHVPRV